jgi:3-oxoacyl-[acyl-carrier-protein] synthase II
MKIRIVVTGMGAITPMGHSAEESWQNAKAGVSGIGPITLFDKSLVENHFAGEVKAFDPAAVFGRKEAARMDRVQHLGSYAAQQALEDSGLNLSAFDPYDIGCIMGSGIGGISTMAAALLGFAEKGHRGVSPTSVPQLLHDCVSSRICMQFNLRGPNYNITSACATGNNCIGDAADLIRAGRAKVMVAGASEAAIIPMVISGFNNMKTLSRRDGNPAQASRPFDLNRDGFIPSEGAAVVILERLEDALERGAKIYGEVRGYGHTSDAYHVTAPMETGEAAAEAMRQALRDAGLSAQEIDYVNAHGTGTLLNDKYETTALKLALGEQAYTLPISSTKSMTGHMLGAAGAIESIFSLLAIRDNFVPPTINLDTPDPDCDLNYTPNVGHSHPIDHVLNYSAGFGGHNVALVLSRYEA